MYHQTTSRLKIVSNWILGKTYVQFSGTKLTLEVLGFLMLQKDYSWVSTLYGSHLVPTNLCHPRILAHSTNTMA